MKKISEYRHIWPICTMLKYFTWQLPHPILFWPSSYQCGQLDPNYHSEQTCVDSPCITLNYNVDFWKFQTSFISAERKQPSSDRPVDWIDSPAIRISNGYSPSHRAVAIEGRWTKKSPSILFIFQGSWPQIKHSCPGTHPSKFS